MQALDDPDKRSSGEQPIVLTTDFGLTDSYVGVMKGVILGINPGAAIIDLTHNIQPQNILQASFTLATSYRFFPKKSVHAVVVDPGVGTARRALLLDTPQGRFLAPDNGVLSGVLADFLEESPPEPGKVELPDGLTAYSLTNAAYWLDPVSQTFHGRDVFSPVAAHLCLGVGPDNFGESISEIVWLPAPQPARHGGAIDGEIMVVDHFGNLVSNIPANMLSGIIEPHVEIKGRRISGLSRTFHDPLQPGTSADSSPDSDKLVALLGSSGFLGVAVPDGNAAALLGADVGEPVRVVFKS